MWLLITVNFTGKVVAVLVAFASPAAALGLWFLPDFLLAYHLFAPRAQGLVKSHRRFATTQREVWLTIDDGPDPEDTPRILALLEAHGARASFFVIGQNVANHPELVRAMLAAGHEVAHHTQTHPVAWFWCALPFRMRRELDDCLAALRILGVIPTRFRPPVGIKNLWLARALRTRGLSCIGWSARGLERYSDESEPVAERVLRDLAPGAILLLHEGSRVPPAIRVHAIRQVLERLRDQGFRCVVPAPSQLM